MSKDAIYALLSSGVLFVIVGAFGSLLEEVGKVTEKPRLESFGRAVEAVAADLPKLVSGLLNVYKGLPK